MESMISEKKKIFLAVLLTFIITFCVCSFLPRNFNNYGKLSEINNLIENHYANDFDKETLSDGGYRGTVLSLGDPHSYYLSKDECKVLMESINGTYRGIGVEVYLDGGNLVISTVFANTPAYYAGLKSGDILKSVDDLVFDPEHYDDFIYYLRGISEEAQSTDEMNVTYIRDGKDNAITINRDDISKQTVYKKTIDNILYIRFTDFTNSTVNEFSDAIEGYEKYDGLILDVRDNPGGLLTSVTKIADMILPESTITYTLDKNGKRKTYNSAPGYIDIPIVVLINESSASASEILAASLHDNGKAYLIGTTSFGKGSVQEIFRLSDGSALKLTVAHYYTPSDVCIDGTGITPDMEVSLPEGSSSVPFSVLSFSDDLQLKAAYEYLMR